VDKVRACRGCGRTPKEVRFDPLSVNRCTECTKAKKAARDERIAERGPRVVTVEKPDDRKNPAHLGWLRTLPCTVKGWPCSKEIHAHHIRTAATAGTGIKPPDADAVPLCSTHHDEGHRHGWETFQNKYQINLRGRAAALAAHSPHIKR
jgi:hypothetical protein